MVVPMIVTVKNHLDIPTSNRIKKRKEKLHRTLIIK